MKKTLLMLAMLVTAILVGAQTPELLSRQRALVRLNQHQPTSLFL